MDGHFRAFSFVDWITGVESGVCIQGRYVVPSALESFPVSLVAEATGQLAAWSAMAAIGFTHRPVAGIAGRIELISAVRPGQILELAAEIESLDTETVAYSGAAHAGGVPVIRLHDCVGPMVPAQEFDDPQSLRDRFARLTAGDAPPGTFRGLPALDLGPIQVESDRSARAVLQVPKDAPFFADHFPRRPVFPGTLLMHANLQTAAALAAAIPAAPGARWVARFVSDVKLRTFISPGETLGLEAKQAGQEGTSLNVAVESRLGQRLIGSAEITFVSEVNP
jgi:3-hydroxymyristoyl/3-hydroxydecanoyl-(acyl carrier protein) dehydratase